MSYQMICTLSLQCDLCDQEATYTDDNDRTPWFDARRAGWNDDEDLLCPYCVKRREEEDEAEGRHP